MGKVTRTYKIRKGMKASELLQEISGKISGENKGLMQQLQIKRRDNAVFEVTLSDSSRRVSLVQIIERASIELYLVGATDGGNSTYFMRSLHGLPSQYVTLPEILDWLNRADMGFHRLQGDLLMQYGALTFSDAYNNQGSSIHCASDIKMENGEVVRFSHDRLSECCRMTIGNHDLSFLGPWFSSVRMEETCGSFRFYFLYSRKVAVYHPEHETVEATVPRQIPRGGFCFTLQRGSRYYDSSDD